MDVEAEQEAPKMAPIAECGSGFADLLAGVMLNPEGQIVMLRAYVDASKLPNGVFCISAVAFGYDRAIKAERRWVDLYGTRRGHMTDLHARKKEFDGISPEEADRLCRGSIAIINELASYVVCVSCGAPEVTAQLPASDDPAAVWLQQVYRGVYPCALNWLMGSLGSFVGHKAGEIAYLMEAGDDFSGAAANHLHQVAQPGRQQLRRFYGLSSYAFAASEDVRLFEAADLAAWEWATHVKRLGAGQRTRPSLTALMGGMPCVSTDGRPYVRTARRCGIHFEGWAVSKHMSRIQQIMNASSSEEIGEILQSLRKR